MVRHNIKDDINDSITADKKNTLKSSVLNNRYTDIITLIHTSDKNKIAINAFLINPIIFRTTS